MNTYIILTENILFYIIYTIYIQRFQDFRGLSKSYIYVPPYWAQNFHCGQLIIKYWLSIFNICYKPARNPNTM